MDCAWQTKFGGEDHESNTSRTFFGQHLTHTAFCSPSLHPPPRSMRALRPATFSSDRPGSAELRALLLRDADRIFALLTAQVPEAHVATGGTEVRAQSSGALRLFSSSQALWKRMFLPRRGTRSALLSLSRWMLQGIPFIEHGGKLCSSRISSSAAVICFHMHTRISPAFVLLA